MLDLNKRADENERQYLWRIGQYIKSGQIENWKSITPIINEQCRNDESEYRDESAYRKPVQYAEAFYEDVFSKMIDDEYSKQIAQEKRELQKERAKLRTEKIEYNRWLRENARDELYIEQLIEAVNNIEPLTPPSRIQRIKGEKEYALLYGDEHFGAEFEIRGLYNEIINSYSPEIFEQRMWELLDEVISMITTQGIKVLHVFSFGDFTDGVLRVGQLARLKYGVVEGTVKYEEFIVTWLNELSKHVVIYYQMIFGNHPELRFFNQPNGSFKNENMGKLVVSYIKARLSNNPNFIFVENPSGHIFANIAGYNFLGVHGEEKDLESVLKDYSLIYKTPIDFLAGGHLHHSVTNEIGVNHETVRVPSIIGIDPFSMKIKKTASPAAKLLCFEEGKGIVTDYRIKLS